MLLTMLELLQVMYDATGVRLHAGRQAEVSSSSSSSFIFFFFGFHGGSWLVSFVADIHFFFLKKNVLLR